MFDSKCSFTPLPFCLDFFALDVGHLVFFLFCFVLFFNGIQHSTVDVCSVASCNFGVLAGEDEHIYFYSTNL